MASVLIVDDSRTSRRLLRDIVERAGYSDIMEGKNGQEGFQIYKEHRQDIVLLDITMPMMDGLETLQLIKNENPDAWVVMVTAAGQKDNVIKALKYGANEFISKPYEREDVIRALSQKRKP